MKDKLYKKAIAWIERKGFKDIKSTLDEFESPSSITRTKNDAVVAPDFTGKIGDNKSYIEVVTKDENKQNLITKWKLYCALASRKGGKLYLLAGRGYKTFADNIIKNYNLQNVTVVSI